MVSNHPSKDFKYLSKDSRSYYRQVLSKPIQDHYFKGFIDTVSRFCPTERKCSENHSGTRVLSNTYKLLICTPGYLTGFLFVYKCAAKVSVF